MSYCSVFETTSFENCLTDLSVSELLRLKHSLQNFQATDVTDENHYRNVPRDMKCKETTNENCDKPATMALVAEERGYDGSSHASHESWQPEEKPSKLQTLFQISVTALAFLSFGGYLLCLIVQSIKNKGATYFHPATSTMTTMTGVKRIKVYRRNRRSSLPPIEGTQTPYNFYGDYNNYEQNANEPYKYYEARYRGSTNE